MRPLDRRIRLIVREPAAARAADFDALGFDSADFDAAPGVRLRPGAVLFDGAIWARREAATTGGTAEFDGQPIAVAFERSWRLRYRRDVAEALPAFGGNLIAPETSPVRVVDQGLGFAVVKVEEDTEGDRQRFQILTGVLPRAG